MARGEDSEMEGQDKNLPAYKPLSAEGEVGSAKPYDYAGNGGTDGVQSEASTAEFGKLMAYPRNGKGMGLNVKTPQGARFTDKFNDY